MRLLLAWLADRELGLRRLVAALKPGGWLVAEEMDFISVAPDPRLDADAARTFTRVAQAHNAVLAERNGFDHSYGRRLVGDLTHAGLAEIGCDGRSSMWQGAGPGGAIWRLTLEQLREPLITSGRVTATEVDEVIALSGDPRFRVQSPITMAAWGRRPDVAATATSPGKLSGARRPSAAAAVRRRAAVPTAAGGDGRRGGGLRIRSRVGQRSPRLPATLARRPLGARDRDSALGELALATTIALPVMRGPVPFAKALTALDVLSEGRLTAGVGPGSSRPTTACSGIPFEERWKRFDEAVAVLPALLRGEPLPGQPRYYPIPARCRPRARSTPAGRNSTLIGSWGSKAGLARVASSGDGWLASAYNTAPEQFAAPCRARQALRDRGREADGFPNALATMLDLGLQGPGGGRSGADRRPGSAPQAGSGSASPRSASVRRALRRAPGALCRGRLPAALPRAAGRRAAAAREGGGRVGVIATIASTSTGMPNGNSLAPIAERA